MVQFLPLAYRFSNDVFSYDLVPAKGRVSVLVDFYCEVIFSSSLEGPVPREILPFPGAELVTYTKGSGTYIKGSNSIPLPARYLLGQPTSTRYYTIAPGSRIFFIRFRQHLLKYILQDTGVWRDTVFDWTDKFPQTFCDSLQTIIEMEGFTDRITQAEKLLEMLLPLPEDPVLKWLTNIDQYTQENISVVSLARLLNMSVRQLERKFIQYVDLSPKHYLRLRKLSDALDHYARHATSSVTDASYEGGFTDQSHFIKTFKLYAREAPLKFFKAYKIKSG